MTLAALRALAENATKGPWRAVVPQDRQSGGTMLAAVAPGHQVRTEAGSIYPVADLRFIAAAREAVPALIADLEMAWKVLAFMVEAYDKALGEGALDRSYPEARAALASLDRRWKGESDAAK